MSRKRLCETTVAIKGVSAELSASGQILKKFF